MAKDLKFRISLNIDGKEQLTATSAEVKKFRKHWDEAESSAQKFSRALMNLTNATTVINNLGGALGDLSAKLNEFQRGSIMVQQQTGLMGEAMQDLRGEVQAVADTYGKDFTEVLTGVSRLMKGFGVDADEAMRLVRGGLVSGADAGGQFFDMLQEYPAYFKEAGVSAEQFVAILSNGGQMGVFNDKAADTIKEGNLRLREMTKATKDALDGIGLSSAQIEAELKSGMTTTFEVMQQVGAKLKELPQTSAEVGAAIADIFGGPGEDAGIAYIESLSDMELGMDGLIAKSGETAQAMDSQVDGLAALNSAIGSVVDAFGVLPSLQPFLNITSQLGMTLTGLGSLVSALKAANVMMLATKAKSALVAAGNVLLGTSAAGAAASVSTLTMALRAAMVATGVGAAVAALSVAVEFLSEKFGETETSVDGAKDSMSRFSAAMGGVKQTYESTLKQTYTDLTGKYVKLQQEWKSLTDEHSKMQWIKDNQAAFEDLSLSINNVADADAMLNEMTDDVVDAFSRRAQAAAIAAKLVKLYAEQMDIADQKKQLQPQLDAGKNDKRFADTGTNTNDFVPSFTKGADGKLHAYSSRNVANDSLNTQGNEVQKQIDDSLAELKKIGNVSLRPKGKPGSSGSGQTHAPASTGGRSVSSGATSVKPAEQGSLDWYDEQIRSKRQQMSGTGDVGKATSLYGEIEKLQEGQKELKIKIGIEQPEEAEVKTAAEEMRERYEKAAADANQIKSDFEIGIITDKADAEQQLAAIDEELKKLGLKPLGLKIEVDEEAKEEFKRSVSDMLSSLNGIDLSSFDSVKNGLTTLQELFKSDDASGMAKGFAAAGAATNALGDSMQKLGADSEAAKAGLIASALGQLALSYAAAMKSAAEEGWVAWLAFGLSGLATLLTISQTLGAFAQGGIVGGNSRSGDKLLARVNSGEMILNSEQQARLWKIVNGSYGSIGTQPRGVAAQIDPRTMGNLMGSAERTVHVELSGRWSGKDFMVGMKNARTVYGKSGVVV